MTEPSADYVPARFRVEHNGFEWCGTFQVAVTAILSDLLSDGLPVEVVVVYEDGPRTATITSLDEHWLYAGTDAFNREGLLAVEVP